MIRNKSAYVVELCVKKKKTKLMYTFATVYSMTQAGVLSVIIRIVFL